MLKALSVQNNINAVAAVNAVTTSTNENKWMNEWQERIKIASGVIAMIQENETKHSPIPHAKDFQSIV